MRLCFGHHELRCLVDAGVRTVPVDDHAFDSAADHVRNLTVDLRCVGGTVADVHVIRLPEPEQQVRVDLGIRPQIEQ